MEKKCNKCNKLLSLKFFYNLKNKCCILCSRQMCKFYYEKNKDNKKDYYIINSRIYDSNNKERAKKYYLKNKSKIVKYNINNKKKRLKKDFNFKLSELLRIRIYKLIKRNKLNKNNSSIKYLGCALEEYKKHLESQFLPEMNWRNHGVIWEIDHMIPISSFDLTIEENIYKAFNYKNTQPLFKTTKIAESLGYTNYVGNRDKSLLIKL